MSSEAIRDHIARQEELGRRLSALKRDGDAYTAGFVPADKLAIEWSVEQTKWINAIGITLIAYLRDTCAMLGEISEAHDRLENKCEEWAAKQLMIKEQRRLERQQEANNLDPDHQHLHPNDFVGQFDGDDEEPWRGHRALVNPKTEVLRGFMDEIGTKWFQECNAQALTTGYVMQYVKIEILPDFMLPKDATTATIEQYILEQFTDFSCLSVLNDGIRFEVALPVGMYARLSTGGDRFLHEVTRGVADLVQGMFIATPFGESIQFGGSKQPMLPTENALKGLRTFSQVFAIGIRFPRKKYKHDASLFIRSDVQYRLGGGGGYNMPGNYVQAQGRF
jgi:hypothetical protein